MEKTWTNCSLEYPLIKKLPERTVTAAFEAEGDIITRNAFEELKKGIEKLYDCKVSAADRAEAQICLLRDPSLAEEAYSLCAEGGKCVIRGGSGSGILYGVFDYLRLLQLEQCTPQELQCRKEAAPDNSLRMMVHWDNTGGDIERGYSGRSLFFDDDRILVNERTRDYARLASSVGINSVVINNTNVKGAAVELITERYYESLRRLQEVFSGYGIRMFLAVDYTMPMLVHELDTADPDDPLFLKWWRDKAKEVWQHLPGLGGFVVKADSEGRPGPFTYGKNHADGANVLADALKPFGGLLIWRCFVYNCMQDWRDMETDRAKASYDYYAPLDGCFRDNVILEIKNGPMDFQVREPVSPLIGALEKTQMLLEVQIAQEYTGQQRHVCYLLPWFREILDQDMCCCDGPSRVADLIRGTLNGRKWGGIAAIANTGNDKNWTGHDLAAANFYGVGRLAFDLSLSAEEIAKEWVRLTFGANEKIEKVLTGILMRSWHVYESYNAPLGIGWMCNPEAHYGPSPMGYEFSRWGTYHHAGGIAVGIERSLRGTGFTQQYAPALRDLYETKESCPEELLLFFHRVPYSYRLRSGKTLLQHIYDTHFEGAKEAAAFLDEIESLKEELPPEVYERMHERFVHQKEHAKEWRDVINTFFFRLSGIPDERGRKIYP